MKINFTNISINKKLALFAFLLGCIAMFMHDPMKSRLVTIDANELALKIIDKNNYISPKDLAGWIIMGKADYKLIDIRQENKFKEYNIQTSENIPVASLNDNKFAKTQKIIIYSDDNVQSAQAWFLLKAKSFKSVYMLQGGLDEWKNRILFPKLPLNATPEQFAEFEKMKEICKFFGGQPQSSVGDSLAIPQLALPKMTAPAPSPNVKTGGKVKKEGC